MPNRVSDEEFAKKLARRIVALRKLQNLTQAQVAEQLGITQQGLARYEAAQRRIPISLLPPLAQVLNTSIEDMLGIAYKNKKRGQISQIEKRFQEVSQLPVPEQKYILETLDRLLATSKKAS